MGWNGSNGNSGLNANGNGGRASRPATPKTRKPNGSIKGLLALLIVVGLSVAAYFLFIGHDEPAPVREEKPKVINKPKNISAPTNVVQKVAKPHAPPTEEEFAERAAKIHKSREERLFDRTNGYVKAAGKMLTDDGRVLTFPKPKPGETRIVHTHGRVYECDSEGNYVDVTPKPIFDNSFEQCLVGLAVEGGSFIPGMLLGHDKDEITSMLIRKVEIKPDDPPEVVEKKEAVAALKKDIIGYIKEGGTFDEYVAEAHKQSAHERKIQREGLREVVQMLRSGDTAGAALYRKKFNEVVGKSGMRPLKLPPHVAEALDGAEAQK